ncbi:MAG: NAD(P)H-hydrate dehydratase [Anaerolineaceae bacterium]|nr:NAD(P)H-hydrate dehydratase [Anaerolineaceae bacterium]
MKLVSVAEMQTIEQEADASGLSYAQMMQNAGEGLAKRVHQRFNNDRHKAVIGLIGSGNNGGDGLVALAWLAKAGWQARAYLMRPRPDDDPNLAGLLEAGGVVLSLADDPHFEHLDSWLDASLVLLDAVLGTGFRLPLREPVDKVLAHTSVSSGLPFVVAVDCPSGVDCDSGEAAIECIPADLTVCMAAVKQGLVQLPAHRLVGEIQVVGIGLPQDLESWQQIRQEVLLIEDVRSMLPARPADSHKGTYGTVMVVAGSVNYTGAAYLASKAAYRIGAGLVQTAVPRPLYEALAGRLPETTWLILPDEMGVIHQKAAELVCKNLERTSALLLGPGWGMEDTTGAFLAALLSQQTTTASRSGIGFIAKAGSPLAQNEMHLPPVVVDADGLKLLAKLPDWQQKLPPGSILTPHPGEMAILSGMPVSEIQAERETLAGIYAREWGHILVLKGAFTVVASPDGRTAIVPVASSALASAGTGDVLAGMIAGLCAQGVPAFAAACAGAWLHAQAGLAAAEACGCEASVIAGDVLDAIPQVLARCSQELC